MKTNLTHSPNHKPLWLWGFILLAWVAYSLPWVNLAGWGLGAYDLAEWISLYLPNRPMDTALLLRLPPVLLAIVIGLAFRRFSVAWGIAALTILFISVGMLPPIEFVLDASLRGDVNYSQQFMLAIAAFVGGSIALTGIFSRVRHLITLALLTATLAVSLIGFTQAQDVLNALQQPNQMGIGISAFALLLIIGGINTTASLLNSRREA